jgi:hypothetical protein
MRGGFGEPGSCSRLGGFQEHGRQMAPTLPKADMPRLPCRAHAVGYGEGHRSVVPSGGGTAPASETRQAPPPEAYRFDRAFHSMLAGLTGGISPVALSLAYIDWAWHLAAAPQRQMVIAQDALQSTNKCLEAALHCFSTGHQAAAARSTFFRAGVGTSSIQFGGASVSAE